MQCTVAPQLAIGTNQSLWTQNLSSSGEAKCFPNVFNEPWRFVLKVQPNIIDKVRKTDPEIEARLEEIENYMDRNALENVLGRLLDNNHIWWKNKEAPKHQEIYYLKNKPLLRILDDIKEENLNGG